MVELGRRQRTMGRIRRGFGPLLFLVMLMTSATSGQNGPVVETASDGSHCPTVNSVINNHAQTSQSCVAPHSSLPQDCAEVKDKGYQQSGRYAVTLRDGKGSILVFCDMETSGGGWTVIQRRENGFVHFNLTWSDYKNGFGLVVGEHWLGNEKIHRLTSQKRYALRVEMTDWEGGGAYAEYDLFIVLGEESKYQLIIGDYRGDAGDSLQYHNGQRFSTRDADNDATDTADCAEQHRGGWWYKTCHEANLNGQYYGSEEVSDNLSRGVTWFKWKSSYYTLKTVEMKIRAT